MSSVIKFSSSSSDLKYLYSDKQLQNRSREDYKMFVIIGSTLAFIVSLFACTKSRNYWKTMGNSMILGMKYNLLGARENVMDFIHSRYNKTDLPAKSGCVAIVTGGSRGIGKSVVKMLLECDMHVIIGCRNVEAGERALEEIRKSGTAKGQASVYRLDNSSLESVKEFANKIHEKFRKINFLINNAGVMFPPYEETIDGFEQQWEINYLSHFLLTAMLMPQLRNAGSADNCSRVVNVTSCAHLLGNINFDDVNYKSSYNGQAAYAQSKLAQLIFTKSLDEISQRKNLPIRFYAVHPGVVNTDLFKYHCFNNLGWLRSLFFKTPEKGATGIVYAVVSPNIEYRGGIYLSNCVESSVNQLANEKSIQEKLLTLSLQQTKLHDFFEYL